MENKSKRKNKCVLLVNVPMSLSTNQRQIRHSAADSQSGRRTALCNVTSQSGGEIRFQSHESEALNEMTQWRERERERERYIHTDRQTKLTQWGKYEIRRKRKRKEENE